MQTTWVYGKILVHQPYIFLCSHIYGKHFIPHWDDDILAFQWRELGFRHSLLSRSYYSWGGFKVDVWESFMVSIKSFDLCGLQHAHLWSRSMPRLTVHLEMAHSDSEGRMPLMDAEAMVLMDSVYWVPGRRHLVHTILFHLFTACEVGAIIFKDEESVFLWDSGTCPSAHGYSTPGSTLCLQNLLPVLWVCYPYKTGLSFKSPWKQHPKDDKRHALSYLDFTRDVTFSVIRSF